MTEDPPVSVAAPELPPVEFDDVVLVVEPCAPFVPVCVVVPDVVLPVSAVVPVPVEPVVPAVVLSVVGVVLVGVVVVVAADVGVVPL